MYKFKFYCLKNEKYLAEKNTFYVALGLPTVPLLKCCTAKEARTFKEEDIGTQETNRRAHSGTQLSA